ncbi:MAG: hypothetical protein WA306_16150 [Candidatus Acidiferrales bacterium]
MGLMRHYTLEQWIDFARNVTESSTKERMQSHLDAGCARCSKELSLWQHLHQVAQRTSELQPSEGALRSVRNAFVEQRAAAARARAPKAPIIELLFDSLRTPLLAGVRSSANHSRQLLYGSATYRIDVRIEPQIDTEKVILIGQILNSSDPHERLAEVPVTLWKGRKILAESVTNHQGEFQIECAMDSSFRLAITLPGQREVSLPLIEPVATEDPQVPQPLDISMVKDRSREKKKSTRKKE